MERRGDNIDISLLPVAPDTIRVQSEQVELTSSNMTPPTSSAKLAFGPRPNTKAMGFNLRQRSITFLLN